MSRVVVVGSGRSGLAVAAHLARMGTEAVLTDRRAEPDPLTAQRLAELGVPGVWGEHPLTLLDGCQELVLSPGVPPSIPFVQEAHRRHISVIGELELAHRVLRARNDGSVLLAVTGTNGKSTTTDLTAHLLKAAGVPSVACGNLGTPLLAAMEHQAPGTRYALECSSYQLETVHDFHAEAFLFHAGDEVANDLEIDVRLKQGQSNLAESFLDVALRKFPEAAQIPEDLLERGRDPVEHHCPSNRINPRPLQRGHRRAS